MAAMLSPLCCAACSLAARLVARARRGVSARPTTDTHSPHAQSPRPDRPGAFFLPQRRRQGDGRHPVPRRSRGSRCVAQQSSLASLPCLARDDLGPALFSRPDYRSATWRGAPVTKPRRRQARRRRTEGRGRRRRRAHLREDVDSPASQHDFVSYRPRDQSSPVNGVDSLDRHISRATETEDSLERYLRLLRFARATTLLLALLALVGSALFGVGVGFAIAIAGLRPLAAVAIGASGSAAFGITVVLRMRAYLAAGLRALLGSGSAEPTDDRRGWEAIDPDVER